MKKEAVLWGFTPEDSSPYLDYKLREELFREAVIATLINENKKGSLEDEYCKTCKQAKPDVDCSKCDRSSITVIQEGKKDGPH